MLGLKNNIFVERIVLYGKILEAASRINKSIPLLKMSWTSTMKEKIDPFKQEA